jgi:signal transduction histidine kinase
MGADRERLILDRAHAIEDAMSQLHQLYERSKQICEEMKKELGYDFVAVQLVDLGEQTIQTMHGSGLSGDWYKIAKHSLQGDWKFLDIQACVALANPPIMEVIEGWDDRFDSFIYRKFGHQNYVRAFVPLIVRRHDQNGSLMEADPRQFRFEPARHPTGTAIVPRFGRDGLFRPYEVIGTVEAGFDNSHRFGRNKRKISEAGARRLFGAVCKHGYALHKATLLHVLEVITRSASEVAGADYANLHFPLDPSRQRNTYNVWSGPTLSGSLRPRPGGLAERALAKGRPLSLSGQKLAESNPQAYAMGIHAMAAYPLVLSEAGTASAFAQGNIAEKKQGVLYVAFKEEHDFTEDEMGGLQLFTNLAEDAIRHAMHSMDAIHAARQLANLHDISRSLADEADHEYLLQSIAGHSLNVLAADLVIIYEYDQGQQLFLSKPAAIGRRETKSREPGATDGTYKPPQRLVARGAHFARSAEELVKLYAHGATAAACRRFVKREKLSAGTAVPLWFGDDAVGIIFVNYRGDHNFSKYEQSIIETLASTAAVAIQYRRLLREREQAVLAVTHQLRNSLNGMRLKILQTREEPEIRQRLAQIAEQLGSLDAWNEALFVSLSREGGQLDAPELHDVDIPEEISWSWDLVKLAQERCDLKLSVTGPDSGKQVTRTNREILRIVLQSLFDNARKYADPGSELRVEWSVRGGSIKVRSIGAPVSPDEREKIFNKFSQGREVARRKTPGGGVGLGLWLTRQLMSLLGGDIRLELETENPRATTFVIRLPHDHQ